MGDTLFQAFAMPSDSTRLAHRNRPSYRAMMAEQQEGKDWITGARLTVPCIDHDHETGLCRLILNRATNTFEGKVRAVLLAQGWSPQRFAQPLFDAWQSHTELTPILYEIALEAWPYLSWERFLMYIRNLAVYYGTAWVYYDHLLYEKPSTTGH